MKRVLVAVSTIWLMVGCTTQTIQSMPSQQEFTSELGQAQAQKLEHVVRAHVEEHKLQGISISIASAEHPIFSSAVGWASRDDKRPMTPATPSMVGSVSKLFTVTAVMKLAEQGKLDLYAPITDYLPEYQQVRKLDPNYTTPQVRHLLYHHSGIQSDLFADFDFGSDPETGWQRTFADLPQRFETDVSQVTEPDTVMSYSNLSFSLLAIIIERASGLEFEQFMQQAVFEPLTMHSASFVKQQTTLSVAAGHQGRDQVPYVYIRDLAAGSMIASTDDLVKFGQMILQQGAFHDSDVLGQPTVEAMLTRQNTRSPLDGDFKIGYGFWLDTTQTLPASVPAAGHGGDLPPYHAYFLVLPEHDLTLAILANSLTSSMSLAGLADELAFKVLAMQGRLPESEGAPATARISVPPEEAVYSMPFGYVALQQKTTEHYKVETPLVNFRAQQNDDDSWQLQYRLFGLIPLSIDMLEQGKVRFGEVDGQTVAWLYVNGTNLGVMVPVEGGDIPNSWMKRTGSYKTDDERAMFKSLKVYWDDKHQMLFAGPKLALGMGMFIPAKPIQPDLLQLQGYGRNLGEIMEWVDEDTIRYSGLIYKR